MKAKKTEQIGMNSYAKLLSEDTDEKELIDVIKNLNNDEKVNGILVQLPLPKQINADSVINTNTNRSYDFVKQFIILFNSIKDNWRNFEYDITLYYNKNIKW